MKRVLLFLACLAMATAAARAAKPEAPAKSDLIGRQVEDFKLGDFRGTEHSLSDYAKSKAVVIAFLGTECPLAKTYAPRLAELATAYQNKGVTFLAIDANRQDSLAELAAFARDSGIAFPILKDTGNVVADQIGAERTPEVFVLDKNHKVRYRGRIDDRSGVGYIRDKVEHNYLGDAIDAVLSGKKVKTATVDPVGCLIGRVHKPNEKSEVTYSKQIARIFADNCVECHRAGEIGPFAMSEYSEVAGWADMIGEVVKEQRMPPWHADPKHGHFRNDRSLSAEEREQILAWVEAGAPEGNPADLPEPKQYVQGWTLPTEPEMVVTVQDEAYTVPADGVVNYQYFVVDPHFTEDKWVKASQIIPGSAPVVHHVLCFVRPPGKGEQPFDENGLGFLAAYVPGYRATPFPEGMAKFVPAGSKLIFQMHYTPVGKEMHDQTKIGFVFAKPEELTHMVQTVSTGNRGLNIPPNAEDYRRESLMAPYKHDLMVLSYAPHMHVRGKSFSYEAVYPDGKKEMLLDVPHYDFNWQTSYEYAEPKVLPPGTRVHCVAHWDNSENNLANPDPSARVHWGDQTFEEMMIGFFDVAVPLDREQLLATGKPPALEPISSVEDKAQELIAQFDRDGDGKLVKDELPQQFQGAFGLLDANKDESIDVAEATNFVKMSGGRGLGGGRGGRGRGDGARGEGGRGDGGGPRERRERDGNRKPGSDEPAEKSAGN